MSANSEANTVPETPESRRGFAMCLMIACSTVMSFGGLIIRNIEEADAWQMNFYRSVSIIGAVSIILVFQYRKQTINHIRNIGRPGLLGGALLSIAGIAFIQALTHTTVANALFTMSAIPFITAGLARIFLGEHLQKITVITMIVAALGVFVMVAEGVEIGLAYGNVMALVTAISFSSFTVIVRHNRGVDMLPTLLVSGVIIGSIALIVRADDLGVPIKDILLCFLWGGVLSGFANWAFITATRYLVAAEVTLFMLLEFALGPMWVWLFVGETPTKGTLIGGTLVIVAVIVFSAYELRRTGRTLKRGRPSPG